MVKKRKSLKDIKVRQDTYEELVKILSLAQLEVGERLSFDDVIRMLLERYPKTTVSLKEE